MTGQRFVSVGEAESIVAIKDCNRILPRRLIAETGLADGVVEIKDDVVEVMKKGVTSGDGECRAGAQERVKFDEGRIEETLSSGR